jgi:transketolase
MECFLMSFEAAVHAQAIEIDRLSLEMCAASGTGHPSSSMSIGHLVTVLMFHTMRWSPDYPDYPTSDRLVLSEGHAVPAVYAAAAKLGVMVGKDPQNRRKLTLDDLKTLRAASSVLDGHPNPMEGFPFFDAATGSLGQGLSIAAGLGEAAVLDGNDRRVYCIIGDGESREGQIAEALDYLIDHKLANVLPIFNCNEYGQADRVSPQQSAETITAKLTALGFEVKTIDGHNPAQIKGAFEASPGPSRVGAPRRCTGAGGTASPRRATSSSAPCRSLMRSASSSPARWPPAIRSPSTRPASTRRPSPRPARSARSRPT